MKTKYRILTFITIGMMLIACSGKDDKSESDSSSQVTQIQEKEATTAGRMAARELINVDRTDTFAMQDKLLKARAKQSEYVTAGRKVEAEIFDTAFIHTLRAVSPDIAREVEQLSK